MAVSLASITVSLSSVGVSLTPTAAPFYWTGESLLGVGVGPIPPHPPVVSGAGATWPYLGF
jgi:hypothetical protein